MNKFPILLLDIVGFTSRYKNDAERQLVMQRLQELMNEAGKYRGWTRWFEGQRPG